MTDAILQGTGERPVLRFERHLGRPVEDVWHAVTDPEEMRSWFPTRIVIDEWRVGATLSHVFEDNDIAPLPGYEEGAIGRSFDVVGEKFKTDVVPGACPPSGRA